MNANHKAVAGALAIIAGAWLLHEAYEGSGRKRPFALKFLPGA